MANSGWVDTHVHLWDLTLFSLPWAEGAGKLSTSHILADYEAATAGLNVTKGVYMEVDVEPNQRQDEVDYVSELCADPTNVLCGAIIAGDPTEPGFEAYVRKNAPNPYVKGLRRVLHPPECGPGYCLSPQFIEGIQLLGELGLAFDLCLRPGELSDGAKLVALCPGTTFVVDHCGNPSPHVISGVRDPTPEGCLRMGDHSAEGWTADMAALAALPNTYCKLSGIIARADPEWTDALLHPTYERCIEIFGPSRCFFGGDWPVCTMGAEGGAGVGDHHRALLTVVAKLPAAQHQAIMHDNAVRAYGLDKGASL
eukprot:SAG11_NODE_39_length_21630_cov_11.188658_3_plen_311_part_00